VGVLPPNFGFLRVSRAFNQGRLIARLTELFVLLALILACLGLYWRHRLFGGAPHKRDRLAHGLGRQPRECDGLGPAGALLQIALGLAIGIPSVLAGRRVLASLLYSVGSRGTWIIVAACGSGMTQVVDAVYGW
jgi:hypothetical protein